MGRRSRQYETKPKREARYGKTKSRLRSYAFLGAPNDEYGDGGHHSGDGGGNADADADGDYADADDDCVIDQGDGGGYGDEEGAANSDDYIGDGNYGTHGDADGDADGDYGKSEDGNAGYDGDDARVQRCCQVS